MPLPPPRRPVPTPLPENDPPAAPAKGPLPLPPAPKERVTVKMILQAVGLVVLIIAGLLFMMTDGDGIVSISNEQKRILGLGRLNPLPPTAKEIQIIPADESPDHQLSLHFSARDKEIEDWLKISPGTSKVLPNRLPGNIKEYLVAADPFNKDGRPTKVLWKHDAGRVVVSVGNPTAKMLENSP